MVPDRRVGVAGHEEDDGPRPHRRHGLRDLGPAHAGHDDVGEEQVDVARVAACELEHGGAVGGLQDGVPVRLQDLGHQLADDRLVLDEQDRLVTGARPSAAGLAAGSSARSATQREENAERRAQAGLGRHLDRAAALLDDAVHGRETEAGAARLRGEERVEELAALRLGHADARVGQPQLDEALVVEHDVAPSRSSPTRLPASRRAR